MSIKDYSTSPGANTSLFPEGMNPAAVNDGMRQVQADIRAYYENPEFRDLGDVPTYVSANSFNLINDRTAVYTVGRRINLQGPLYSVYATITASSVSSGTTTITASIDSGTIDNTLNAVAIGFAGANNPINLNVANGYGTGGGTAAAQTVTIALPLTAYYDGMPIAYFATAATTGAFTINVNGLGAVPAKFNAVDPVTGFVAVGTFVFGRYRLATTSFDLSITETYAALVAANANSALQALPAGSVKQVISVAKTDSSLFSGIAGVFNDVTGLAASVTPAKNTNKVLITVSISHSGGSTNVSPLFRVMRGSTAIAQGDVAGTRVSASFGGPINSASELTTTNFTFLDSPAAATATAYSVQIGQVGTSANTSFGVNRTVTDTNSASYMRTVSTITLQEIVT